MIIDRNNNWQATTRTISARVELYKGSTLANTFTEKQGIKEFTIERLGENKYFGYGVCQQINLVLVDKDRLIDVAKGDQLKVFLSAGNGFITPYPAFHVEHITRDENTNVLTITGYDLLYGASAHTIGEVGLVAPYTIANVAQKAFQYIGGQYILFSEDAFTLEYENGANLDGTESIREVLNAIAEATQTIYYLDYDNTLIFIKLGTSVGSLLVDKSNYFTLEAKEQRTLTKIVSATELGDNVSAGDDTGDTQYVRDNPFWELREDIDELLARAITGMKLIKINQFHCVWRGDPRLEVGDKISVIGKDNMRLIAYVVNDSITFNGGLKQITTWEFNTAGETASNPNTLGAVLKKTYAKVDKANKEIEIVAGETAEIRLTTDGVQTSVKEIDNNVSDLVREVSEKVSADDVVIVVQQSMGEGADKITTSTGYTFNEEGLHISKSESEITTSITEDGMTVFKKNNEVLKADNEGVKAEDLHATTFLIIGKNSRLEDFNNNRTGCFWIGG